ncbi:MAG: hypothetical protein ACRDRI_09155 [Pseudonocardiaceae bacterium]
MAHELSCPHCGCPLLATEDAVQVPEVDNTVEILHREIEHLRATVARLRGAGVNLLRRVADGNPATS